jgi:predicted Zn-dependent peptidase
MSLSGPEIKSITSLTLPHYETTHLDNGMPMFMLPGGSEPVMKIEIIFRAGAWYEHKQGVAEFASALLSEGTQRLSSVELAEAIESRGATIQTRGGVDTSRVRLYTLTRFLPELLDIITEVVDAPAFDPGELKVFTDNKVERLKIDLKKNEVLAYRHLTEAIFGPHHPYGKNLLPEHYLTIKPEDLRTHHHRFIQPSRGMVFVSGSFGAKEEDLIRHSLGKWQPPANGEVIMSQFEAQSGTGTLIIDGPQEHQAAIRIGRKLFPQSHPDFTGLSIVNCILGGYFGSRLMAEIREQQGLTYGIYSSMDSFAQDGCFYISTETATSNVDRMIESIGLEVKRLREELIPQEELAMARNYMMGHLMTQLDGPFASMDFVKALPD